MGLKLCPPPPDGALGRRCVPSAIAVASQTGANSGPPGEGPSGGSWSCGGCTAAWGPGAVARAS